MKGGGGRKGVRTRENKKKKKNEKEKEEKEEREGGAAHSPDAIIAPPGEAPERHPRDTVPAVPCARYSPR